VTFRPRRVSEVLTANVKVTYIGIRERRGAERRRRRRRRRRGASPGS